MNDLLRAAEMGIVPLDVFKSTVRRRLSAALKALELIDEVPNDIMDIANDAFMQELNALDEFLYAIGRDDRRKDSTESAREHKLAAKRANPSIELIVMRIDERVQQLVQMFGSLATTPAVAWITLPLQTTLVIKAVVELLDLMPAVTFAEDRIVHAGSEKSSDPTVEGVLALMRERKATVAA